MAVTGCLDLPAKFHLGDVGIRFLARFFRVDATVTPPKEVPINISTATAMTLRFEKPTGGTFDRTLVFLTDGSDGLAFYDSVAGDLSEGSPPNWKVQGHVVAPTFDFHTSTEAFTVDRNLPAPP